MKVKDFSKLTEAEIREVYLVQKIAKWQKKLDGFTEASMNELMSAVSKAKVEIKRNLRVKGSAIKSWDKTRQTKLLGELNRLTLAHQAQTISDIALIAGHAGETAFGTFYDMVSWGGRVSGVNMVALPAATLKSLAMSTPVGGRLLSEWVNKTYNDSWQKLIKKEVTVGMLKGEGYRKIVKRLIDEGLEESKHALTTLTRTYVQSANATAMQSVYEANDDLIKGVKWSAALETGGTCLRCAALDGEVYEIYEHPFCPLHPNCRCVLVPVTKTFEEMGLDVEEMKKAIRPAVVREDGAIGLGGRRKILEIQKHDGDYASWIARQKKSLQVKALGPKRFALYDSGQATLKDMVDLKTGRLYLLDELTGKIPLKTGEPGVSWFIGTKPVKKAIQKATRARKPKAPEQAPAHGIKFKNKAHQETFEKYYAEYEGKDMDVLRQSLATDCNEIWSCVSSWQGDTRYAQGQALKEMVKKMEGVKGRIFYSRSHATKQQALEYLAYGISEDQYIRARAIGQRALEILHPGKKSVQLARGIDGGKGRRVAHELGNLSATNNLPSYYKVTDNAVSGYTILGNDTAKSFGTYRGGVIIRREVPFSDIVLPNLSEFTANFSSEAEYIVISGTKNYMPRLEVTWNTQDYSMWMEQFIK